MCVGHRAPGTRGDQGSNPGSTAHGLVDVGVFFSVSPPMYKPSPAV